MNLISILQRHRLITGDQADDLARMPVVGVDQLLSQQVVTEDRLQAALSQEFRIPVVDLSGVELDRELIRRFPGSELFRRNLLPLQEDSGVVQVATHDPLNLEALEELAALSGLVLDLVLAPQEQIARRLKEALGVGGGTVGDLMALSSGVSDERPLDEDGALDDDSQAASVVKLVNEILLEAIRQRASDIHMEPSERGLEIRYRIDGMLLPQPVPVEIHRFRAAIVSRLKIMARLNIAEKRLPQDGRVTLTVGGREIDVRMSVIPMLHGEGIVLRLLDKSNQKFDMSLLELPPETAAIWSGLIHRPHGMVLVTGPTGSGKTTTLYSSLAEITGRDIKIVTIEDPVEYQLPGVNQIQVQSQIGLTFAAGLRSILRHDPDVILIGEIRDHETAVSAMQASLTGHLVLSTLHTNDAASAYTRLIDMGIEPYLVASTLEAVLAQRLVRKLCSRCRQPLRVDALPSDFEALGPLECYQPVGCRECHGTGYAGRVAIFELLRSDSGTRSLCIQGASANEIKAHAVSRGMQTLRQSGWQRVARGLTSFDEVLRVCASDDEASDLDADASAGLAQLVGTGR
jgi:type II secretory ATPase GspE/PulE/Tfp pilus assembly ATPase PilB-like protein